MVGGLEPVPETAAVLRDLKDHGQEGMVLTLMGMGKRATALVPHCVGLSLGLVDEGLTFTLVSSDETAATLDAMQYVDHGPCVDAADRGEVAEVAVDALLDEERWLFYARASAALGIASTLGLPILVRGEVIGGVNLYGSTSDAFEGNHEALAEALGASAEGAVRNADLSFATRRLAAESAPKFEEMADIAVGVGIIMARYEMDDVAARAHLRDAAARAGITEAQAARAIKHMTETD